MSDALMVTSSFLPGRGGIESYLGELCDLLAPRIAVIAAAERDGEKLPDDLEYPTHPFPGRMLSPGPRALAATVRAASVESADKVIFGTPWPLVLMGPKLKTRGLRYSVIVHGAEMLVPSAIPAVKKRLARALAGAELLFPVSHYTADALRGFLTRHRLEVPPMHLLRAQVDLERFHPRVPTDNVRDRYGIQPADRVILCFGRLVKRKGVDRMIEALPRIIERIPGAVLVVAGTGPEEKRLRGLAQQTGARVIFAGRVPDEDAPAVYAMANVFALPVVDRWRGLEIEGLGVVLLEAAACGTPSVTGRSGGTPEAVIDGVTGYVIDATDRDSLVERTVVLLGDTERAQAMGRAGREHVRDNFSAAAIPQGLLDWLA